MTIRMTAHEFRALQKREAKRKKVWPYKGHDYDSRGEVRFAGQLEVWEREGIVELWRPHPGSLRFARKGKRGLWAPDFLVAWDPDIELRIQVPPFLGKEELELVEIFGFMPRPHHIDVKAIRKDGTFNHTEKALDRIKACANYYPCFSFSWVGWMRGEWKWKHF